ncbi:PRC-barrel domain-containing protein [Sinorhizobium meliloti]|uniref:PRC-barrel domain-containing protein n=1 Tax=Rhizobium meliloti TaxID=382 RepID=UPI003F1384FD
MKALVYSAGLLAVLIAPAFAQDQTQPNQADQTQPQNQTAPQTQADPSKVIVLSEWRYDPLYATGWSVDQVFDEAAVVSRNGEEIGDVENIIFNEQGDVVALIAEVGGLWEIGDTHVSIPWSEVELSQDAARITVPVTEETADDYAAAAGDRGTIRKNETGQVATVEEDTAAGSGLFKATDIMGDGAYLNSNQRYGYVNDLIVNDGRLAAVVSDVRGANGRSYYAFPYTGSAAWTRDPGRYDIPYGPEEVTVVQVFEYDKMQRKGATDQGTTSSTQTAPNTAQ